MRGQWGILLAVGILVVAEAALGVLLVVNGGGSDPSTPNPWRIGDGYPEPPPCSAVDQGQVEALVGTGYVLTETNRVEDDDPVRVCTFARPRSTDLTVRMQSRVIGRHGPLEINRPGLSDLRTDGNLTRRETKRTSDYINVTFTVDNLDVLIGFTKYGTKGELPAAQDAQRMKDETTAIARRLADRLAVRNQTRPSPSRR